MSNYIEKIKQRFLSNNFSKPEELYDDLMDYMQIEKDKEVIPWLKRNIAGESIVDIGGGNGYLIKDIDSSYKVVIDKREFNKFEGINYIVEDIADIIDSYTFPNDCVILSEFLHLFSCTIINKIINSIVCKRLIIIENKYDNFLDLRLRLWTPGKCINQDYITSLVNCKPSIVGDFLIWDINK